MNYLSLDVADVALGAILVFANAALSLWLNLRIEGRLLIAAARMVVQLFLVGLVLETLFAAASPMWTALTALVMILFAGREIVARQSGGFTRAWAYGLGTGTMLFSAAVVTVFALSSQIRPDPWWDPRYALPVLGMVLGNTMTGIALGLQVLTTGARRNRAGIEARLALGADRHTALMPTMREALGAALMPIINAMAATGLVALPGMMTGQILSGVAPMEAVKYQSLIMFLIAGGTGLGAVLSVVAGTYRLTDGRHRLRLDRLMPG